MPRPPSSATSPSEDEDFDPADAARRRARRKALWWLFGGFALLFALMLWGLIADEPPPDISDLRVSFARPAEERNAYARLAKLATTLPPEPNNVGVVEERHFSQIFTEDPRMEDKVAWDQNVVASVLSRYPADLVDSVREALEAPESEAPELTSYSDTVPEIGPFRALARILTWHAELAWHRGDHTAAADMNLLALKLGHRISHSRGPLITVLTGTGVQNIAFASIQRHADSETVAAEALHRYLEQIARYEIAPEVYHTSYKLETLVFAREAPKLGGAEIAAFADIPKTAGIVSSLPGLWQPNRTVRWHAECIRAAIAENDSPPSTRPSAVSLKISEHHSVPWPRRAQNLTGRVALAMIVPSLGHTNLHSYRARANLRLTRLYVALRLHHLEHEGSLPDTLSELVSARLPSVPLDPFDGAPLRYDPALSTIWSVDQKRLTIKDADGDFPEHRMPAYRLRFARPPAVFPTFAEYEARQNASSDPEEQSMRETAPSDVSPPK